MHRPTSLKTGTLPVPDLISRSPLRRGFLLVPLTLTCFAFSPAARAVDPPPDGGYPNGNTAEGESALFSLTTGSGNTASGYQALFSNKGGDNNTANGAFALQINTIGNSNTATGEGTLFNNTTGNFNTATGVDALVSNGTGDNNTATGVGALRNNNASNNTASGTNALLSNTSGFNNAANGFNALSSNRIGTGNTANGAFALRSNTTASNNTANGQAALANNTIGGSNTADGFGALRSNTTGSSNIALGNLAGASLTTGSNNIDIGNRGVAGDTSRIRIGTNGTHTSTFIAGIRGAPVASGVPVVVSSNGQLGTVTSSERFKQNIKPMEKASEAIMALKPVTFRYKGEFDPERIPQFGLIAEQVEKVNPDLVVRDDDGKVMTVRYEAVNAMLLNEFLKEHKKVEEQDREVQEQKAMIAQINATVAKEDATISQLKSTIAQQQKDFQSAAAYQQEQIEALTAGLQSVSARLELNKPAPQMVADNH